LSCASLDNLSVRAKQRAPCFSLVHVADTRRQEFIKRLSADSLKQNPSSIIAASHQAQRKHITPGSYAPGTRP
jgi:hypothetical protein